MPLAKALKLNFIRRLIPLPPLTDQKENLAAPGSAYATGAASLALAPPRAEVGHARGGGAQLLLMGGGGTVASS